ncbi:(2Fe-2S)-binding protein [Devosia geojensis]|uniref:(2Fe-2S)-binding protein n=1 Tax=Devosia geojensis TaxID=443610 RepID=A0A0F5FX51_9HYPH|nr:aromatic ring-hydroxylating dioxygenase subunit alpha [Devosia geojensis]KKB13413.1 (2Fe-2S)-binding protein [Devosia geojensis]
MPTAPSAAILDAWHVFSAAAEIGPGPYRSTLLLDTRLDYRRGADGAVEVRRRDTGALLPVIERYGFAWTSLGTPPDDLFPIPEFYEPDRKNMSCGSIGVNVSAPRAIENFLDMGHFPYVHTGILGEEPHTEVKEYDVEISYERDEILATRCRFYQPRAALSADEGQDVEYIYRVPHPYCSVLYKSCPADESRLDVIAIFCQPMSEDTIRAHLLQSMIDEENTLTGMRRFQQTIFGQDKPILENQYPKRLPLDPRAETPIRADKSAIAYRRWLSQKGVNYGVIPQAA